jgi:D-alanine-D-alanine ligase
VEKAVKGREFECGVIGDSRDIRITMPGEVVYQASFYDYNAKYHDNESKTLIPAPIPEEQAQLMMKMAGDIFKATDGRGYARVDFFMDEKENIIFNEINTVPGFTSISMFHKLWEASGVPLSDMLDKFVEIAIRGDA